MLLLIKDTIYIEKPIKVLEVKDSITWIEFWAHLDANMIIAILALIVSVVAIISSIIFNYLTLKRSHKHNELTNCPLIVTNHSFGKRIEIDLVNNGLGPARITDISFNYNEHKANSIANLINIVNSTEESPKLLKFVSDSFKEMKFGKDYWVAEKSNIRLMTAEINTKICPDYLDWSSIFTSLIINITYFDIYGNKYVKGTEL